MNCHPLLLRLSQLFTASGALIFLATLLLFSSWLSERSQLHDIAKSIAARSARVEDQLSQLTAWVYQNKGFAKNTGYFLWKRLEATPLQVLRHGGDCEDKSKLLSTLAQELGIPSTMAMLYHCEGDCRPVHTVALAKTQSGWTPLDAVYNITFRNPDGTPVPVQQMMRQPDILTARLDELADERGPFDKVTRYKRDLETYTHLTTLNWEKNSLTRTVASTIRFFGGNPRLTPRPLFLDDPKQFFSIAGFGLTAILLIAGVILGRIGQMVAATGDQSAEFRSTHASHAGRLGRNDAPQQL